MKKFFFIILLPITLISSSAWTKNPKYPLAICAIFRNEAPFLKQWIDFHYQAIGVSQFYLYNNESTDNFRDVLSPYISLGLVKLIEWPSIDQNAVFGIYDHGHCPYQFGAYRDCLQNLANREAEWVAIIDIDEYIVPGKSRVHFHNVLKEAKKKKVGSFKVRWKTFGTSHIESLEPGERLVKHLVWRAPDDYSADLYWPKSIHQPKAAAKYCNTHDTPKVEKGYRIETLPDDVCRIHHYWSGTQKRCDEKRVFKSPEEKETFLNLLNSVEDYSIYPYLDQISETQYR